MYVAIQLPTGRTESGRTAQQRSRQLARCSALAAGLVLSLVATLRAQEQPDRSGENPERVLLYDDPRTVRWSKLYRSGQREELLAAVESDLKSASPHPFAPHVWTITQYRMGKLRDELATMDDAKLQHALGPFPEIYVWDRDNKYGKALSRYPPERAAELRDPWTLFYLGAIAYDECRYRDSLAYATVAARRRPDSFISAWVLFDLAQKENFRGDVRALASADGELGGTMTGKFLSRVLAHRPVGPHEKLAAVNDWLRHRPRDARALRFKGSQLEALERDDEIPKVFAQAAVAYPFMYYWKKHAVALIKLKQLKQARQVVADAATIRSENTAEAERLTEQWFGRALAAAGENGRARTTLEEALKKWPDHAGLLAELAEIELDRDRFEVAVPLLRRATEQKPDELSYHVQLMTVLRKTGRADEAWSRFQKLNATSSKKNLAFLMGGSQVLAALGRSEDRVSLCQRALERYPRSAWVMREFADALGAVGRPREALEQLRKSFEIEAPYGWSIELYAELLEQSAPETRAPKLQSLREQFPWVLDLWKEAAERLEGPQRDEKQLALWREAIAANPGWRKPWREAIDVLIEAERWNEAHALGDEMLAAVAKGSKDDQVTALFDRAIVYIFQLRKEPLDAAAMKETLDLLEAYREAGGYAAAYHQFRAEVLSAMGRKAEAARAHLAAVDLRPDRGELVWDLVTEHAATLGRGTVMARAHRHLERDPTDGDRLARLIHLNVMWSGSPIIALQLVDRLKKHDPDHLDKEHEAMAWGQLGDRTRQFTVWYGRAEQIKNSDRYVGWYKNVRLKAQAVNIKVEPNYETGVFKMIHPDGRVQLRRDHPISGKPLMLQVGAAKMEFDYDELGNRLQQIRSSSGAKAKIIYDSEQVSALVSKIEIDPASGPSSTVRFEYNSAAKPTRIAVTQDAVTQDGVEIGGLSVEYDQSQGVSAAEYYGNSPTKAKETIDAMQALLSPYDDTQSGRFPELPHRDQKLDALRESHQNARRSYRRTGDSAARAAAVRAGLSLAEYLGAHLEDRRGYAEQAGRTLEEVMAWVRSDEKDGRLTEFGVQAVSLWYELMKRVRPEGLTANEWNSWLAMRDWLERQAQATDRPQALESLLQRIESEDAFRLLQTARWLPKSYLSNPGYYRRYRHADIVPERIRRATNAQLNAVLVRRNGDVVVGTEAGLAVLRRGFWEWFGFDERSRRLSGSLPHEELKAGSDILDLVEDHEGALWIGTANGLLRVSKGYGDEIERWTAADTKLPTSRAEHLAVADDGILVGTSKGLVRFAPPNARTVTELEGREITLLKSYPEAQGQEFDIRRRVLPIRKESRSVVLVGTDSGLYSLVDGEVTQLRKGRVDDAVWSRDRGRLFILDNGDLYEAQWNGTDSPKHFLYVHGQQDVVASRRKYGVGPIPLDRWSDGIAVLTDLGLSIYNDSHFEHLDLPRLLSAQRVGVRAIASRGLRTYMLTTAGVYAIERGRIHQFKGNRVDDLLTMDQWRKTFVARGNSLDVVDHDNREAGPRPFAWISATHLARDKNGRLLVNDGLRILRYEAGSSNPDELFTARQTVAEKWTPGEVTSILAASDGSVWVTAGASVFRWQKGQTQEFSMFVDPERFPARSEMISRVVETYDGDVWVVASDESHLDHRGVILEGGLLEWTYDGFRRLPLPEHSPAWFLTGYTRIDEETAIAGTTKGFARHRAGRYATFRELKEASYQALLDRTPLLWLGTDGAKLGEDVWLFGCAGGVVAYHDGQWLFPDRLNRMLPDQHLSDYGGRTVHAVATDKAGGIYAGTDRGLLIYESGGGDAAGFLISNHFSRLAYESIEKQKLEREADIFLRALKPDTQLARRIQGVLETRGEIEKLQSALSPGVSMKRRDEATVKHLREMLSSKERVHRALLARLEREHRGLFQLLQLQPLDLAALRRELRPGQVILQYLPTDDRLYIQVLGGSSMQLREVEVSKKELYRHASLTSRLLSYRAKTRAKKAPDLPRGLKKLSAPDRTEKLESELAWLYERLLRPVESDLDGKEDVFVVPVETLCYVPFGALVRSQEPGIEYAVERYSFGYLPSMYLFDLVLRDAPSIATDCLVMADPDGSLPGARKEATDVRRILGGSIACQIGKDASLENLIRYAPDAEILHLATHGRLDAERPERSSLLLASDRKLSVVDAQLLPLQETRVAVLSACESGLGGSGMEYATLARAFAHAGVPTTIATLWRVDDDATQRLMELFYKEYQSPDSGENTFAALAKAQREMLRAGRHRAPFFWSGIVVFGKP